MAPDSKIIQQLRSEIEALKAKIAAYETAGASEISQGTSPEDLKEKTGKSQPDQVVKESNDLLRYIIEHANSSVAVLDRELNYIYVSRRYLNVYAVKEKNVIGKHHYDVFPDLPQKWRKAHQLALKGKVSTGDRDENPREDGTIDYTRWECRPWYEESGDIGGIVLYTEIITERIEAESAMKVSESRFRMLAESAPVGILITDREQNTLYSNRHFTEMFMYSLKEIPSVKEWWPLAYPDKTYREQMKTKWSGMIELARNKSELIEPIEGRVQCKDGRQLTIEFRLASIGELNFVMFSDITERKRAETEIYELKNNLERKVEQQTTELKERISDLERFHQATIDREFRIKELKNEIARIKKETE